MKQALADLENSGATDAERVEIMQRLMVQLVEQHIEHAQTTATTSNPGRPRSCPYWRSSRNGKVYPFTAAQFRTLLAVVYV